MRRCAILAALILSPAAAGGDPPGRPSQWGDPYTLYLPDKGSLRAVDGEVLIVDFGPEVDPEGPEARGLKSREVSFMWRLSDIVRGGRTVRADSPDRYHGWYLS